jgi:ferrous iron transport protein B
MGIERENWPATVGLFTGIFAKEAVVGTLDSIYHQMEVRDASLRPEDAEPPFDLLQSIADAFAAIPAGYEGFWRGVVDPLGLSASLHEVEEADSESYSTMVRYFGRNGKKAAFAYLLFILIYAPCVAAMAAICREIGPRWMVLATTYLTVLAWVTATAFYQTSVFSENPTVSAGWLGVCAAILLLLYGGLRLAGRKGIADNA